MTVTNTAAAAITYYFNFCLIVFLFQRYSGLGHSPQIEPLGIIGADFGTSNALPVTNQHN